MGVFDFKHVPQVKRGHRVVASDLRDEVKLSAFLSQLDPRVEVILGENPVLAGSVHHDDDDALAKVAPAFIVGGTADAILAYLDGRADISVSDLVASLTTLWLITGNGAAEVARTRN